MKTMKKVELNNLLLNRQRIGSILKAYRETNDLSQRDVAIKTGYTNINFISMIETGRSSPPIGKLLELCEAVGADYAIIPIAVKYLYPETWKAMLAALINCPEIFGCSGTDIDKNLENRFVEMIKSWSSI